MTHLNKKKQSKKCNSEIYKTCRFLKSKINPILQRILNKHCYAKD